MPWTTAEAMALCRLIEGFAPTYGCHVALTGGTLYKDGPRKDADILFYKIRQVDDIDAIGLFVALSAHGFEFGERRGWCQKATFDGKSVDLFFPEDYPSSSAPRETGDY